MTERPATSLFSPELEPYRHEGDEPADRVVRAVFRDAESGAGIRRVFDLLAEIIDLEHLPRTDRWGPEYTTFLDETLRLPDWYDAERAEASVEFFSEHGWTALAILGCGSLPAGYSIPEVTKVLGTTQAMGADSEHVDRRLWETAQFVVQVMEPGGLDPIADPDSPRGMGARRAQKVRLFHAIIRFLLDPPLGADDDADDDADRLPYGELLLRRHWNRTEWGVPIHQAHLAGTVLIFSFAILKGLRDLNYLDPDDPQTAAVEESYMYRWNVIGHLMGVPDELLRWDYDAAEEFLLLYEPEGYPPDPDRDQLIRALLDYMHGRVPRLLGFLRPTAAMLMHILLDDRADELQIPLTRWQRRGLRPMRASMRGYGWLFRRLGVARSVSSFMYERLKYRLLGPPKGGQRRPVVDWLITGFQPEPRHWRQRTG